MSEMKKLEVFTIQSYLETFPYERFPDFHKRIKENWLNLKSGRTTGKNCAASRIRSNFKIHKLTAFTLWIYICFFVYNQKGKKISFSEKRSDEEESIWRKIIDEFEEIRVDIPNFPEVRTLRKVVKRKDFEGILNFLTISEEFKKDLVEYIHKMLGITKNNSNNRENDHLKILEYLKKRKNEHVTKRELGRALNLNKVHCDQLLNKLMQTPIMIAHDYLEIVKLPRNSVRLKYKGP